MSRPRTTTRRPAGAALGRSRRRGGPRARPGAPIVYGTLRSALGAPDPHELRALLGAVGPDELRSVYSVCANETPSGGGVGGGSVDGDTVDAPEPGLFDHMTRPESGANPEDNR